MKYITIPHIYQIVLNKDISHKCNYNCTYCIAKNERIDKDIEIEDLKWILKDFDTDITLTGTGEPLLEYDKIIDVLEFVKNNNLKTKIKIITNGSKPSLIQNLLNTYPDNVIFVRSITINGSDTEHNSKDIIWDNRIQYKLLVNVNEDWENYVSDIINNKFMLRTLSKKNIAYEFENSKLQQLLLKYPQVLQKMLPIELLIYGFNIACVGNILNLEVQCMPIHYTQYHNTNNLLKGIMLYKDAMYDYMLHNYSKCCCLNEEDNLEANCFELYYKNENEINNLQKEIQDTENIYECIIQQPYEENKPILDVAIDLYNQKYLWVEDPRLQNFCKIFKNDITVTTFIELMKNYTFTTKDKEIVCVAFPIKNNNILLTGKICDIYELLTTPDKYNLHGKIYSKMFRYLISIIRA